MRNLVLFGVLVVTLTVANWAILDKERVLRDGRTVLLELAPADPRSILQGDYMTLRYVLAEEVGRQRGSETSPDGRVVIRVDPRGLATLLRFDDGSGRLGRRTAPALPQTG